ncbi:Aste57867_11318 [Aphanomyces stellatus]|uniref:Aste57867_11318 protein n=1 Tax=Aphanomyces stellatus TaxID=120398 RepID=A0A485KSL0_9STRA|nr:hypothetical protein As57867_011276 [Aphanomyces stellatus]VFT88180.1 Aste57867_11318 [Aphanomyces stellatus]
MELQIHVRRARYFLFHSLSLGSASLDGDALELRVQCTINGELRSTGSASRLAKGKADGYAWRQESGRISWHLTTKELKLLKSKSPTLKLYVFAIGDEVHSLGWFFMDLRTPDTALRWVKLVNSKYSGEIQVSSQLRKAPPPSAVPAGGTVAAVFVDATPDDMDECLVVGENPLAVYVLSIVVEGARQMGAMVEHLLKKCSPLELKAIIERGFWLSYSIFDVVVQTDVFHSLDVAAFDVIRDSFRLKSSVAALKTMLQSMKVLPVFLCTVDRILCRVEIPVAEWISPDVQDNDFSPLRLTGPFSFLPSLDTKGMSMGQVLVFVDLHQEKILDIPRGLHPTLEADTTTQSPPPTTTYVAVNYVALFDEHLPSSLTMKLQDHEQTIRFDTHHVFRHLQTANLEAFSFHLPSTDEMVKMILSDEIHRTFTACIDPRDASHTVSIQDEQGIDVGVCGLSWHASPLSSIQSSMDVAHFALRVQVASIKYAKVSSPVHVEYAHPFYPGPILHTNTTAPLKPQEEIELMGGDTLFDRVSKPQLQLPIVFHVVGSDSAVMGHAVLSLQYLLHAALQYECQMCGEILTDWTTHDKHDTPALYRPFSSCDVYVPVMATAASATQIAVVHVLAKFMHPERLSDEGLRQETSAVVAPISSDITIAMDPSTPQVHRGGNMDETTKTLPSTQSAGHVCTCAFAMQKERAAFAAEKKAWEVTKRKQQAALEQMEAKRMESLEAEWALREKERMQAVREAQQEYVALEKKLRQTLHDLDLRERALVKAEETLQHKLVVQKQEMDILQRKSKSETQHALSLADQQKQTSDLLRQQMEDRAVRAETQLKQLEQDIAALRIEQRKSPENVLRQEIIQHQATIATLEKQLRLLQVEKDKEIQVQKELGVQVDRLTQLLHQEKRKQEDQKVQDLEALRLKYIAREERYVLDGDREELKAIKKQLDILRDVQFSHGKEFTRLQQEKQELLATGQYTEDSYVIQELNRLIASKRP